MISAKQAREVARPNFDRKASEAIRNYIEFIDGEVRRVSKKGAFTLGVTLNHSTSYELNQVMFRLRKLNYEVTPAPSKADSIDISWMKQLEKSK